MQGMDPYRVLLEADAWPLGAHSRLGGGGVRGRHTQGQMRPQIVAKAQTRVVRQLPTPL
jgi:hypothetical protein